MRHASLFLCLGLGALLAAPATAGSDTRSYVSGYFALMLEDTVDGFIEREGDDLAGEVRDLAGDLDSLVLVGDLDGDHKPDQYDPKEELSLSGDLDGDGKPERLYAVDLDGDKQLELFAIVEPKGEKGQSGHAVAIESLELAHEGLSAIAKQARKDKLPKDITGPLDEAIRRLKQLLRSIRG